MTSLKLALGALVLLALAFRLIVACATRAAERRVSPEWLIEHRYDRTGDTW